jgi:hypothetical protein
MLELFSLTHCPFTPLSLPPSNPSTFFSLYSSHLLNFFSLLSNHPLTAFHSPRPFVTLSYPHYLLACHTHITFWLVIFLPFYQPILTALPQSHLSHHSHTDSRLLILLPYCQLILTSPLHSHLPHHPQTDSFHPPVFLSVHLDLSSSQSPVSASTLPGTLPFCFLASIFSKHNLSHPHIHVSLLPSRMASLVSENQSQGDY